MRTGPERFQSSRRTAIIAALFACFVLLLALSGSSLPSDDGSSGTGETPVLIPARVEPQVPGVILAFIWGVSISILGLVFRGGRTSRRFFHDRTIRSAQSFTGIVSFMAAFFRAVILFLRPTQAARRYQP